VQLAYAVYEQGQEDDGQGLCQWQGEDYPFWCKGLQVKLKCCGSKKLQSSQQMGYGQRQAHGSLLGVQEAVE